jgi:hypothetical protein
LAYLSASNFSSCLAGSLTWYIAAGHFWLLHNPCIFHATRRHRQRPQNIHRIIEPFDVFEGPKELNLKILTMSTTDEGNDHNDPTSPREIFLSKTRDQEVSICVYETMMPSSFVTSNFSILIITTINRRLLGFRAEPEKGE